MDESRVRPAFHPRTAARILAALGSTVLAAGTVPWTRDRNLLLQRWASRLLASLGVESRLEGPIPDGAPIWVSNHLSWVDPLLFLALRPSAGLAKAEVADYPVVGEGARRAGFAFVDRSSVISGGVALKRIRREFRAGHGFLLFPEGTTTAGGGLAPIREGGIRMAYRLGAKVLPFCLTAQDPHYPWVGDAALLPHLGGLARAPRTRVTIRPGTIQDPAHFTEERLFVEAVRASLDPRASLAAAS
jgi:lyso-ornithine lipid O-acyltransferase